MTARQQQQPDWWRGTVVPFLRREATVCVEVAAMLTGAAYMRRFVSQWLGWGVLNQTMFEDDPVIQSIIENAERRVRRKEGVNEKRTKRPRPGGDHGPH